MTKKEMFLAIASVPEVAANDEFVKFLARQVELLDNRKTGSHKPTAKQEVNETIKGYIKEILTDGRKTCGEIIKALASPDYVGETLTSQRVSALLRQMGDKGTKEIVKDFEKKVAYFYLASLATD